MIWNEGYVSDIKYTYGFYNELSPLKLTFAASLKSLQIPNLNKEFTYCELGCGRGYSSNLLASAYPNSHFYANDFNPSHILEAKSLAEAAGTKNVQFFDDSFEEFIHRDLPKFDFICLHGIYSWISSKNRQAIVNFIADKINIGGLVYISYNALPGWAAFMPMRALMLRQEQRLSATIINRIEQALTFTGQVLEANAAYFVQNPSLKARFDQIKQHNRNYLAHEYFNQDWNSFYFDQVAYEFADAKLNYVGSAHLIDHIDVVNLSPAAQQQLAQIDEPIYKEVVRDFFLNTQFRRDIFARGILTITSQEQVKQLQQTRFALIVPLSNIKLEQQFPLGSVVLQESVYLSICKLLAESALTTKELQNHPQTAHISLNTLYEALIVMTGIGYIHPAVDDQTCQQRKPSTDAFNNAVKTKAIYSDEMNFLASPLIGNGVIVNRLEQLFLLAKSHHEDEAEFVWKFISSQEITMIKDGKTLQTPEENLAYLKLSFQEFAKERFLLLKNLGID